MRCCAWVLFFSTLGPAVVYYILANLAYNATTRGILFEHFLLQSMMYNVFEMFVAIGCMCCVSTVAVLLAKVFVFKK
jgi:hypothetical protein